MIDLTMMKNEKKVKTLTRDPQEREKKRKGEPIQKKKEKKTDNDDRRWRKPFLSFFFPPLPFSSSLSPSFTPPLSPSS